MGSREARQRRARNALEKCPGYEPNPIYVFLERCQNCGFAKSEHTNITSEGETLFSYLGLDGGVQDVAKLPVVQNFLPNGESKGANFKVVKRKSSKKEVMRIQEQQQEEEEQQRQKEKAVISPKGSSGRKSLDSATSIKTEPAPPIPPAESAKQGGVIKRLSKRLSKALDVKSLNQTQDAVVASGLPHVVLDQGRDGENKAIDDDDDDDEEEEDDDDDKKEEEKEKSEVSNPAVRLGASAALSAASSTTTTKIASSGNYQKVRSLNNLTQSNGSSAVLLADMRRQKHLDQMRKLMHLTQEASSLQAKKLNARRYEEPSKGTLEIYRGQAGLVRWHSRMSAGWSVLHVAAWNRDLGRLQKLLKYAGGMQQGGVDVDGLTGNGRETALSLATKREALDCVGAILAAGADANLADAFGFTPLHYAVRSANSALVSLLMERGKANVNAVTNEFNQSALHLSARYADKAVMSLLLERGMDINKQDKRGWSPLFYAVMRHGQAALVAFMIEKGAAVSLEASCKVTPMHCAALSDDADIVSQLIELRCRMDTLDSKGWSPLHYCARYNAVVSLRTLLEYGARPSTKPPFAEAPTPYDIAAKNECTKIIDLLSSAPGFSMPPGDSSTVNCEDSCLVAYELVDKEMDTAELEGIDQVLGDSANSGKVCACLLQ